MELIKKTSCTWLLLCDTKTKDTLRRTELQMSATPKRVRHPKAGRSKREDLCWLVDDKNYFENRRLKNR